MIKAVIPALLLFATAVGPASATFVTGNDLLRECKSQVRLLALGYTAGVADLMESFRTNMICIPKEATVGQLTDVICQYIEQNPGLRHENADYLALSALGDTFPCKK